MSFFGARTKGWRRAGPPSAPEGDGILAGVPVGTPLAEVLALVSEGSISYGKAVAALKRDRLVRVELVDAAVDDAAARVLEEYLAARGGSARAIVLKRVRFASPGAFARLCNGAAQNDALEEVAVTHAELSDAQADTLASAISRAPVEHVDLSHNALASPVECIEKLKRLTKLERLNLSGNRLLCGHTLAGALGAYWPSLADLVLLRTGIGGDEVRALEAAAAAGSARFAEYSGPRVVSMS
jgi:hypothetical protein